LGGGGVGHCNSGVHAVRGLAAQGREGGGVVKGDMRRKGGDWAKEVGKKKSGEPGKLAWVSRKKRGEHWGGFGKNPRMNYGVRKGDKEGVDFL